MLMPRLQVSNYGMKYLLTITKLMFEIWAAPSNTENAKLLPISLQVATAVEKPLDIVHVDISLVNTTSIDDFKYALGFVDSFSILGAVHLLSTRAEVGAKRLRFIAELGKPHKMVTDNSEVFKSGNFTDICSK